MTPDLDVIIVSHNTRDDLVACLSSLQVHRPSGLARVIVVDNRSTDGSVEAAARAWPAAEILALDENRGFGAANNVAMRAATAPLLLLLNSDTVVPPGAVDTLVERLLATGAVAAGPALRDADGRPEVSFGPMLTPWGEAVQKVRVWRAARDGRWARRATARLLGRERAVDWVTGACLLVRRDAALAAGLFDERYFLYEEDVDFCAALRARGGSVLFTPAAVVVHKRGRSPGGSREGSSLYDRSHLAFYRKHAPAWAPWLGLWLRIRGRSFR